MNYLSLSHLPMAIDARALSVSGDNQIEKDLSNERPVDLV